jgi:hypothetical protein
VPHRNFEGHFMAFTAFMPSRYLSSHYRNNSACSAGVLAACEQAAASLVSPKIGNRRFAQVWNPLTRVMPQVGLSVRFTKETLS